jgi:2-phospho-L-lactate guanylyltransferase
VKTVAVVPVKALRESKSRLAGALSPQERASLTLGMLDHVLWAVERSGVVSGIGVISPEPGRLALPIGVTCIEQARIGLNNLLEQGREWAIAEGADALMVVFADLPLLSPQDVADVVHLGRNLGTVVLAPDRHRRGTNLMLAHPVSLARFAFGEDSYTRHQTETSSAGAHVQTYTSRGTALDIDTPDDLLCLEAERLAKESTA